MEGYIENKMHTWAHALKRTIGPGVRISLDEIYEQYGPKHNLEKGEEFVDWLRNVKLSDTSRWNVIYAAEKSTENVSESSADEGIKEAKEKLAAKTVMEKSGYDKGVVPPVPTSDSVKEMEIADVVELSVRNARDVVPGIMDIKLLKYALQEANQRAGKDSLCLILRRRIKDLELHRTM